MLKLELEECEEILAEMEDMEVEQVMCDLDVNREDAELVMRGKMIEAQMKDSFSRGLTLCV